MILDTLAAKAKERVALLEKRKSFGTVREEAESLRRKEPADYAGLQCADRKPRKKSFAGSLSRPGLNFICECKKASPSKGLIAPEFPYMEIARAYEKGGAAAISCLTEPEYFLGSDVYLREIAGQVSVPVLRKDFTVSAYQVYEAKLLGAGAVLLICAILSQAELEEFRLTAESVGLDALVETHGQAEIEMALRSGAQVIGINNRDLKDFSVDIRTCLELRDEIPKDRICIAESGIRTEEDIRELKAAAFNGVLIGETLMRSGDPEAMLRRWRNV